MEANIGATALATPAINLQDAVSARLPLGALHTGSNYRRDAEIEPDFRESIKTKGILQSLLVRPLGEDESELDLVMERCRKGEIAQLIAEGQVFQVCAGYRRYGTGMDELGPNYEAPVNIKKMTDEEAAAAAVTENKDRKNPTVIEEAEQASRILAMVKGDRAEAARLLNMKPAMLESRLALMNCSVKTRDAVVFKKILLGHAELLATLPKDLQDAVLTNMLASPVMPTVIEFKQQILSHGARALKGAQFNKDECGTCPHNSDLQKSFFSETLDAGMCTNVGCFSKKCEEHIASLEQSLKDDYQRIVVVRPGDNATVVPLRTEGQNSVGPEQAEACKGCKDFGAAISAVPGKEGQVYHNQCFNPPCNAKKVGAWIKSQTPQAAPTAGGKNSAGTQTNQPAKKAQAATTKAASTSGVTAAVQEYRNRLWRKALAAELRANPKQSVQMLLAICLTNNASNIKSDLFKTELQETCPNAQLKGLSFGKVGEALGQLDAQPEAAMSQLLVKLAPTALDGLSNDGVTQALTFFEVDLSKHFKIDAEFLKLLQKSGIEALAKEIGLAKAMGDGFTKAMAKKKDEIIADFLAVKDFNFSVVPKALRYTTK